MSENNSRFTKKAGQSDLVFIKPADLARADFKGVAAEGILLGTQPNGLNDKVLDFIIQADAALTVKGIDKNGAEYVRNIKSGDTILVNGAGNLGFLMKEVQPGGLCQITYNGKIDYTPKGASEAKKVHNFEVMV